MGGIVEAATAARSAASVRAWGRLIADAAADAPRAFGTSLSPLDDAARMLRSVDEGAVRATGWELRNAFLQVDDTLCVQRSMFGAMSLAQRVTGSVGGGLRAIGSDDARLAATAVAYQVDVAGRPYNLHAAMVARTADDRLLVIDHLVSGADDGVIELGDWMRRIGGTSARTRLIPATHTPPLGLNPGAGIPALATRADAARWAAMGDELGRSFERAATAGRPIAASAA